MSMIASLVLLGFSTTASAESPYVQPLSLANFGEWSLTHKEGTVGSLSLEGTIEVPMYKDILGNPKLQVYVLSDASEEGSMGDLFELRPDSHAIIVTEAFASANNLEVKTTNKRLIPVPDDFKIGGEVKYVVIPTLTIGAMVLNNVTALVSDTKSSHSSVIPEGSLSIGLASLPVSYAILNSAGTVHFGVDAVALSKEIGATTIPYKSQTVLEGTRGSWKPFGQSKILVPAHSLVVDATFGDQVVSTKLDFTGSNSLDKYVDTSSNISTYTYDVRQDWLNISLGEIDMGTAFVARPVVRPYTDALTPIAEIGQQLLSQFDIVVDQSNATIAFAKHDGLNGFADIYDIELENAQAALTSEETDTSESSDDGEENATEALNVAGINGLIAVLNSGKDFTASIEQYQLLLDDADEQTDCALWLDYGNAQMYLGNPEEARKAFLESARLFHSWWDIDLHTRMDINTAQADMKEEDVESAKALSQGADINSVEGGWFLSQPERCYVADGKLAGVDLALSNHSAVEENYRGNLDLDDALARVFANSSLAQGNTEVAHEAYRQAIQLEDSQEDRALNRFGLALVYADQGKWEQANALFEEALSLKDDVLMALIWLNNAISQNDVETGTQILTSWAEANPTNSSVRIALLQTSFNISASTDATSTQSTDDIDDVGDLDLGIETTDEVDEQTDTVDDTSPTSESDVKEGELDFDSLVEETDTSSDTSSSIDRTQQFEETAEWLENLEMWYSTTPSKRDYYTIWFLMHTGKLDEAQALLDQYAQNVDSADLYFVTANLAARQGNTAAAKEALQRAAALAPEHPGFALVK